MPQLEIRATRGAPWARIASCGPPRTDSAAAGGIKAAFDIDESEVFKLPSTTPEPQYTVAQLEAMLAEARKREGLLHSLATEDRL